MFGVKKTITFGIAVYNVADYLAGCIESVIAQKGDDIEILIVDDGSTDGSGAICDAYAKTDERIRVFHKENGGVSSARNVIIDQAEGKWISFIDGDDKLTENAAETVRHYAETTFDIVFFDALFFRFDHSVPTYQIKAPELVIRIEDEIRTLTLSTLYANQSTPNYINKTRGTVWGKIYATTFLKENKVWFDERLRKSQDVAFNLECMRYFKTGVFVRKAIYLYRQNEMSIVRRYNPEISTYNTLLAHAFLEIVQSFAPRLCSQLTERFYAMCIIIIKTNLQLDFCHRRNKKAFAERKSDFESFLQNDWCQTAIQHCNPEILNKSDAMIYHWIMQNDFKAICRYFKKLDLDNRIKAVSNRLGLNKLKSGIRQKIQSKGQKR